MTSTTQPSAGHSTGRPSTCPTTGPAETTGLASDGQGPPAGPTSPATGLPPASVTGDAPPGAEGPAMADATSGSGEPAPLPPGSDGSAAGRRATNSDSNSMLSGNAPVRIIVVMADCCH